MFDLVTIEREFGCGGCAIAQHLAERLGWKLYDQELTEEIARLAHVGTTDVMRCDERLDSPIYRFSKVFWHGAYERGLPHDRTRNFDADCMVEITREVLERVAAAGKGVIVGRGAPYYLRKRPNTFHVFLYAPREEKLRRLMDAGKPREEAEKLLDEVDAERIAFVKHYYGADWPTRSLYHMMINTLMGDDKVVTAILDTMQLAGEERLAGQASR